MADETRFPPEDEVPVEDLIGDDELDDDLLDEELLTDVPPEVPIEDAVEQAIVVPTDPSEDYPSDGGGAG